MIDPERHPRWRWAILGIGTFSQAATSSFLYGMPMLVPALRRDDHLSLTGSSVVVTAPIVGLLLTLIAWGALADRYGERVVMASGLGLTAALLGVTAVVHGPVLLSVTLGLAGCAAASVNAASGRLVMGWFTVRERGLAMGVRQTAQPLGVAIAAISLPALAEHVTVGQALLLPGALCSASAVAMLAMVTDPARPATADAEPGATSPYRTTGVPMRERALWRVHAASALLVVPQFAVATFTLVFLVGQRHWDAVTAGRMIFWFQLAGAAGRVASGVWSDRVRSRLVPMRQLAVLSALLMVGLAVGAWTGGVWIVVVFAVSAVVTVADNGLGYTAVAELAGREWSGRALGVQNTGQNVAAMLTAPLLALIIESGGYGAAFLVTALFPTIAIALTPVRAERRDPAQVG